MAAEAGIETPEDPVASTGDLKSDIEGFTTLDACVRAHVSRDTLFGDALDALGYDTFVRDACRTLQALKARSTEPCRPIAFTALRVRCQAQVATLVGEPNLCPASSLGAGATARDPTCLARSLRDPRMCLAAAASDRGACRALVAGDPALCGADRVCARQATRWRAVLERPQVTEEISTAGSAEVSVDDQAPVHADLSAVAQGGAVLRVSGDRVRVLIGQPKSSRWAAAQDSWAKPQLFLAFALPREMLGKPRDGRTATAKAKAAPQAISLGVGDLTFEMLVPNVAELSGATAHRRQITVAELAPALGSPATIELELGLTQAPHRYAVTLRLQTFVRETATSPGGGADETRAADSP